MAKSAPEFEIGGDFLQEILLRLAPDGLHRSIDYAQINPRMLGDVYEKFLSYAIEVKEGRLDPQAQRETRRREGSFYTPESVTRYLVEHCVDEALRMNPDRQPWELRCLDPACGGGHFLVECVNHVARLSQQRDARRSLCQWKRCVTEHCAFGVDKDRTAVMLTKLSLWVNSAAKDLPFARIDTHVRCGDSLVGGTPPGSVDPQTQPFCWESEFAEVLEEHGGFDVVVGNPPWGADLSPIRDCLEGGAFQLARGQYDSYELFVELGRRLLHDQGVFGFILPDSILLPEHEPLRRMLVDVTTLTRLIRAGEGLFPAVFRGAFLVCFVNRPPQADHVVRVGTLRKDHRKLLEGDAPSQPLRTIAEILSQVGHDRRQAEFARHPRAEFDIAARREDRTIGGLIDGRPVDWRAITVTGRGVELGKRGEVLKCPYCYNWDTLPKKKPKGAYQPKQCTHCGRQYELDRAAARDTIISQKRKKRAWRPLLVGESINRYFVSHRLWIDVGKEGINYKNEAFYQGKRLLVRKTGVGLMATIDESGAYTNQVVFTWKPRHKLHPPLSHYRLEYVLGVLNSRLMLYRLCTSSGEMEWRSFPYLTQKTIERLPIRAIDFSNPRERHLHHQIADRVEAILATNRPPTDHEDYQVESLVMQLYGITKPMCRRIFDVLREMQQLRIVREMNVAEPDMIVDELPDY